LQTTAKKNPEMMMKKVKSLTSASTDLCQLSSFHYGQTRMNSKRQQIEQLQQQIKADYKIFAP